MIRRPSPLGKADPPRWVLIPQRAHARLSHDLAAAWGNDAAPAPFDGLPVRGEFLAGLLHHDDGWDPWWDDPGIDPEHGRPYAFTEMPLADAQRLWTASIEACREIGPLAGWMVAAHFSKLQSKRDADWEAWRPWIEAIDEERAVWLAEWLALDAIHTPELAQRCLALLQAFDWMSLWLCCKCPGLREADAAVPDPLEVADDAAGLPRTVWATTSEPGRLTVSPWPFATGELTVEASTDAVDAGRRYRSGADLRDAAEPVKLTWRLAPLG